MRKRIRCVSEPKYEGGGKSRKHTETPEQYTERMLRDKANRVIYLLAKERGEKPPFAALDDFEETKDTAAEFPDSPKVLKMLEDAKLSQAESDRDMDEWKETAQYKEWKKKQDEQKETEKKAT